MIDVRAHGAVGDGKALDSPAIQQAIDTVANNGGGIVHVPAGVYRCGTIELRSRIDLNLATGAVIQSSHDIDDFVKYQNSDGKDQHGRHLIHSRNCHNVRISGGGVIDGQGPAFWLPQESPRAWIRPKPQRISPCIELDTCVDVHVDGVHIIESAGWTLHAKCCDHLRITNISIQNHPFGPNNDGLDLNGCRDVIINNCRIDTCDDAIVLKTTPSARSCERIAISNCILRTNCAAIKCGTESWHDYKQIVVSNCVIHGSTRAFALYGFDGGRFEQISVSNIVCDTDIAFIMNHPIHLDARKRNRDSKLSVMQDISVYGFSSRTDGRILMTAADGTTIRDVTLAGVSLNYPLFCDPAAVAEGATSHQCSRHSPEARAARAAVVAENIANLTMRDMAIRWPERTTCPGWGGGSDRIENGGDRTFGPADHGDDVAFGVLWARNLRRAKLQIRHLKASDTRTPDCQCIDCEEMELT